MNPIQRYLHKGSLEPWDWARLGLVVVAYILLRPSIEWLMKKWFDADPFRTSQDARKKAKAAAKVSPNAIRGAKGDTEKDNPQSTAGGTSSGREVNTDDDIVLRRPGKGGSEFTAKSFEEQLMDWDDVDAIKTPEGPKGDVTEWVKKWDGLE